MSAATQNPAPATYLNQKLHAKSKHGTVQRELSFNVEVRDRFALYASDGRCLVGVDMFGARRNGGQPHVETNSFGQIQVVRAFGQWGLSLQNPTVSYRPVLSFDVSVGRQTSYCQYLSYPFTRQSLGASINYSGALTLIISVRCLGIDGMTMAGGQEWFLEYYGASNFFLPIGGIGNNQRLSILALGEGSDLTPDSDSGGNRGVRTKPKKMPEQPRQIKAQNICQCDLEKSDFILALLFVAFKRQRDKMLDKVRVGQSRRGEKFRIHAD